MPPVRAALALIPFALCALAASCVHYTSNRPDLNVSCDEPGAGGVGAGDFGGGGAPGNALGVEPGAAYEAFSRVDRDGGETYLEVDLYAGRYPCAGVDAGALEYTALPHLAFWLVDPDGGLFAPGEFQISAEEGRAHAHMESFIPDGGEDGGGAMAYWGGISGTLTLSNVDVCSVEGTFDVELQSAQDAGETLLLPGSFHAVYCVRR
jgi:hypothetical protein